MPDDIVAISAGANGALTLDGSGNVSQWYRVLSEPTVPATNATAIAAGWVGGLALVTGGTVLDWNWPASPVATPSGLTNAVAIASGYKHELALQADGTVVAWGDDFYGQTNLPPAATNAMAICAGDDHSLMLVGKGPPVVQAPVANLAWTPGAMSLSLPTRSGRVYRLEYTDSLDDATWTPLPLIPGTGGVTTFTDPAALDQQRFYRVRQW